MTYVLESVGYENIRYNKSKNYLVFPRINGDNQGSTILHLDNLNVQCFTRTNESGNLYTTVMREKDINFPQALDYIADLFDLDKRKFDKKINYPFGGFYKNLIAELQEPESVMPTYDETILKDYSGKFNKLFFNDGISYKTQEKFGVGYDLWTNRITIPEYTFDGKLCGIMGRSTDTNCDPKDRWFPIIPCSRSLTLYGYHTNYEMIQRKKLCILGESEKFTQQLDSFDCHIGLSSCGCHISETQAKYVKGLLVPRIIVAYDEGLEEEYIREEAKKLKINNSIIKNYVGYIWDKNNDILKKGTKSSPSDHGKKSFTYLIKNCVKWI